MSLGIDDAITSVSGLFSKILDAAFPNPEDKAKAEAVALVAQADAAVKRLEATQAVMKAEAQSADPWTSRARPSFLYVVYVIILAAIPMGIVSAVNPDVAAHIATGFKAWLAAIPSDVWTLFGVGYLGYTGSRTFEKTKGVAKG